VRHGDALRLAIENRRRGKSETHKSGTALARVALVPCEDSRVCVGPDTVRGFHPVRPMTSWPDLEKPSGTARYGTPKLNKFQPQTCWLRNLFSVTWLGSGSRERVLLDSCTAACARAGSDLSFTRHLS